MTVVGAPGIGKSRLAHEFAAGLDERATVLAGAAFRMATGSRSGRSPRWSSRRRAIDEGDGADEAVAKLEALLAPADDARTVAEAIAQLTGLMETRGVVEEGFWAVRRLFASLAEVRPLVVVLDDAQWAEATLLALIENVVRHTESVPIVLLCVSRPDLLERRPDWGERRGGRSTTVRLEPLDDAACDRLIAELLGEPQHALEVRDHVAARAEGNPLFVEQMLSMLIDEGRLEQVDGRWVAVGDLETVDVPPGIHALLHARLERLGADERAVLGRAAVMGQVFYVGSLRGARAAGAGGRIPSLLLELVRKELIRPGRSDFADQEALEFRHLLIRDAAYDWLSKESRADLHARFADWLDRRRGIASRSTPRSSGGIWSRRIAISRAGPLGERGSQLARRAADHLAAAGWTASARGDVSAGVTLRSRALALMRADDARRPQLLADLGDALLWSGRFDEAERALAEAIELAERAGDEQTRVRARLWQMRLRFQIDPDADYEALEAEGLEAAALCEANGDDFGAARAWRVVYWARWGLCKLEGLRPAAERAYEYDRRAQDQHYPQDDLIGVLASLVFGSTPASEVLAQGQEILERVQGHRGAEAYAMCFLGQTRGMLGQRDAAREMILKGVADRRELGDFPGAAMAHAEGRRVLRRDGARRLAGGGAGAATRVRRARLDGRQELPGDHRRLARALPVPARAIRRGRGVRRPLRALGRQEPRRRAGPLEGRARDAARTPG